MRARVLLFDMDGTLINSGATIERVWRSWAGQHGIDAEALMDYSHGRQAVRTITKFAPPYLDPAEEAAAFHAELARCCGEAMPVPGALEFLNLLKDGEWAVVTSAAQEVANAWLAAAGLPDPPLIVGAERVKNSKPDPEGYLLAARLLGAGPGQTIVFEDAESGLQAGRSAGASVVGVGQFRHLEGLADRWIDTMEGLGLERRDGYLTLVFPEG